MWGIGMVFACFVIIAAFVLIIPISSLIDTARTDLGCNNTSISLGEKLTCLAVDIYLPYFILIALFALLAYVIWRGTA